jgi:hypothetical protein
MRKPVLAGVVFLLVFIAVLLYSTLSLTRNRERVEVCMEYDGRMQCATGSGATRESALRGATTASCAQISSGVTGSQQCEHSTPVRVTWK